MSTKKSWEAPVVELLSVKEMIERAKTRERIMRARNLVERAILLMDESGDNPSGAVKAREVLAMLDEALAKLPAEDLDASR